MSASENPPQSGPTHLQLHLRLLLLALLFGMLNAWTMRHLGVDLKGFALVNGAAALFGLFLGYMQESEQRALKVTLGKALRGMARTRVLAFLALALLCLSAFVSSVTVMAGGAPSTVALYLTPEGRGRDEGTRKVLAGPDGVLHFTRFTTPFGRPFYLEAEGYIRHSFDLLPWTGQVIRVAQDLRPTPTILLRVPGEKQNYLARGRLLVSVDGGPPFEVPTGAGRGAVLLGRARAVPPRVLEDWRSELRATPGMNDTLGEQVYRHWKAPLSAEKVPDFGPGSTLDVQFVNRAGEVLASARVVVGSDTFQDVLLGEGR